MSGPNGTESPNRDAADDDAARSDDADGAVRGDTFGVGIHVTDAELQFVVHVPADIDSGWTDPEEFQRLVERAVWDRLDRPATLRGIEADAAVGETVTLGRITLTPDGTVREAAFRAGVAES